MIDQPELFAEVSRNTWPEGERTFTGVPYWAPNWPPCDIDGSLPYWRCARDHGVDSRCSVGYRLTVMMGVAPPVEV